MTHGQSGRLVVERSTPPKRVRRLPECVINNDIRQIANYTDIMYIVTSCIQPMYEYCDDALLSLTSFSFHLVRILTSGLALTVLPNPNPNPRAGFNINSKLINQFFLTLTLTLEPVLI